MKSDKKERLKHKIDYLMIALKISRSRYYGEEPSIELLNEAHELGHLAGISKEELENL
jgi:hypothetical protein